MRRNMSRTRLLNIAVALAALAALASCKKDGSTGPAMEDEPFIVTYTFSSGPTGDGFDWPPSPPGLIDDTPSNTAFSTDESVRFLNDIGNPVYFNDTTLLPDEASVGNGIVDDCLWGNPRPINDPIVETFRVDLPTAVDSIAFDFAWALGGDDVPATLELSISPTLGGGGGELITVSLNESWNAGAPYQNAIGRSGRVAFSVATLASDHDVHLAGIRSLFFFLTPVSDEGNSGAFAIDNLTVAKF